MKKSKIIFGIIFYVFLCINSFSAELKLVTLQYPPYEYEENKEVKGVAVEIVKEVFKRMGQPIKIELLPWARAIYMIEKGEADGIFTAYKTLEREAFADYSKEILMPQVVALFIKEDSTIAFDGDFGKLNKYKFGVVKEVSYGEKFDKAVKNKIITNIEDVTIGEQNFLKLSAGRLDIVVSNKYGAIDIINKLKKSKEIKELLPEVQNVPSYIAFSKKKNLSKIRDKFDEILKEMKKDGSYDKIINDYFREK